jgi:hypothetical protein
LVVTLLRKPGLSAWIELQHRRVEVQLDFGVESVNRDVFIVLPVLEFADTRLGDYSIGFDTSSARVITREQ